MTFAEKEQCNGYYGFGNGMNMPRRNLGVPTEITYCNSCPQLTGCWDAHRSRVSQLFPDLVEEFERIMKAHGAEEGMKIWFEEMEMHDPYVSVMMGNMEDGVVIKHGGKPKDRGMGTIPYPFNVKN